MHHQTDEERTGEQIAASYFRTVLQNHLPADKVDAVAEELANGLRGYTPSIVPIQNGHFTRVLSVMDRMNSELNELKQEVLRLQGQGGE